MDGPRLFFDNPPVGEEKALSKRAAILLGVVVAAVGGAIVAASIWGSPEKFQAPRWVVGSVGGAFLFFGGWTAAIYALGFDPKRPDETLPSPAIQLAAFVPGLLLFAAPFHWIAFGPGPRQFTTSLSIPFFWMRHRSGALSGRIAFGLGALLIDALLIATIVRLSRRMRRNARMDPGARIKAGQ